MPPTNEPSRARRPWGSLALCLLPFALLPFVLLVARFDFLVDDAYISFRYARNLVDGGGLRWNPGEQPPVEGFSNFLWTALCAGFERLGLDPALWTRVAGVACGALLILLVGRLLARRGAATSVLVPALLFLSTLPPIAMWSTGGLETMPFALAVFGSFERLVIDRGKPRALQAGLWGAAAVLLRADGFVWCGIALAAAAVAAWRERDGRLGRSIAIAASVVAGAALAYLAFRWSYFGELQPNTARVKVAFAAKYLGRGAQYVLSLLLCLVAVPIAIAGGAARARRDALGLAAPALVFVLASFAYLIVLGGDWMMMYRMLVPALPFVALLFAAWIGSLANVRTRIALAGICAVLSVLPAFDVHPAPRRVRELAHFRWNQEFRSEHAMWRKAVVDIAEWVETGRALGLETKPGESMVCGNIGAYGYFAPGLVLYDTQGLTNKEPLEPSPNDMPGHDRKVTMAAFEKYAPTYHPYSRVVDAREPWRNVPKRWYEQAPDGTVVFPGAEAQKTLDIRVVPLDPAQGFAADRALLLVRFKR